MFPVNIVIIGGVSVGKSTIVNTLLLGQYSDTNRKRTTALPQIYSCGLDEKVDDIKSVRSANKTSNDTIMNNNTIANITPLMYNVPALEGLVVPERVYIKLHDTPGLNDSVSKEQYYKYITDMFPQYSIILYVVDINSAINTSDEIDILNMLVRNMSSNHEKGIKTKLIVVINKCDDMDINFILQDDELKTMEQQLIMFVLSKTREHKIESKHISFVKMSGEDAFVYRSLKKDINAVIDDKYKDKFGINEFGKKTWGGFSAETKITKLINTLAGLDIQQCLRQTGFSNMLDIINAILLPSHIYEHIWSYHYFNMQNELDIKKQINIGDIKDKISYIIGRYENYYHCLALSAIDETALMDHYVSYVNVYLQTNTNYINGTVTVDNYTTIKILYDELDELFGALMYSVNDNVFILKIKRDIALKLKCFIITETEKNVIELKKLSTYIEELIDIGNKEGEDDDIFKEVDKILCKLQWYNYSIDKKQHNCEIPVLEWINKYSQHTIPLSTIIFPNVRINMNKDIICMNQATMYGDIDALEHIFTTINTKYVNLYNYIRRYLDILKIKAYSITENSPLLMGHLDGVVGVVRTPTPGSIFRFPLLIELIRLLDANM